MTTDSWEEQFVPFSGTNYVIAIKFDKISFLASAPSFEIPSQEYQYNANYLFEIFSENKGANGTGYFDENGILKLEFITEDSIKSLYFLPPKN